jgi:formylglycine-generating enzyme required for sulfatase activity
MDADRIWRTDTRNFHRRVIQNGGQTHPVGTKKPNDLGLYDMIGNVWEWCEDLYYPNYEVIPALDGSSKIAGASNLRVIRGGAFGLTSNNNRAPRRFRNAPSRRFNNVGFRIVATRSLPVNVPKTFKEKP